MNKSNLHLTLYYIFIGMYTYNIHIMLNFKIGKFVSFLFKKCYYIKTVK